MNEILPGRLPITLRLLGAGLGLVATVALAQAERPAVAPADLVLRSGAIYTVDAARVQKSFPRFLSQ